MLRSWVELDLEHGAAVVLEQELAPTRFRFPLPPFPTPVSPGLAKLYARELREVLLAYSDWLLDRGAGMDDDDFAGLLAPRPDQGGAPDGPGAPSPDDDPDPQDPGGAAAHAVLPLPAQLARRAAARRA